MNFRTLSYWLLGAFLLYFVIDIMSPDWGLFRMMNPKAKLTDRNVTPSAMKRTTHEAPIVHQLPGGRRRVVNIHRDTGQSPYLVVEEFDPAQPVILHVATPGGGFVVPLQEKYGIVEWEYAAADSIVVISDIDGNFEAFQAFLTGNHIIDDRFNWTFGRNQLVLLGDVFDRGEAVFECLWLIYKLGQEAEKAGGAVHYILGNHEMMNLRGKYQPAYLNDVEKKYFVNAEFAELPYTEWFDKTSELGVWLRTKNCIEKIGETLFVHGGISLPLLNTGLDIRGINALYRELIDLPFSGYTAKHRLIDGEYGPAWYRGLALEELTESEVDYILQYFGVSRIVIGHTIIDKDRIQPLYAEKVIAIDLHHRKSFENGILKGLLITGEKLYEVDNKNNTKKI